MGQTQTQAVADIEQTRRRLDSELEELATYLPPTTAWLKRIGALVAGLVVGLTALTLMLRKRREREGIRRLRAIERRLSRMEERL